MPTQPTTPTNIHALSGPAAHAAAIEEALHDCWVVILMDPDDDDDWSPWPVMARTKDEAITQAQHDWSVWCQFPGPAEVLKVYRRSWIGEIT